MTYLWANIDAYLKTQIMTDLGPNSGTYSTLRLAEVTLGDHAEPSHMVTPS